MFYPTWGDKVFKENNVIKFVKSILELFPCRCGVTWGAEVWVHSSFGSTHCHGTMAITHRTLVEEGISAGGVMDINAALQEVLKTTLTQGGLAWGISKLPKP